MEGIVTSILIIIMKNTQYVWPRKGMMGLILVSIVGFSGNVHHPLQIHGAGIFTCMNTIKFNKMKVYIP